MWMTGQGIYSACEISCPQSLADGDENEMGAAVGLIRQGSSIYTCCRYTQLRCPSKRFFSLEQLCERGSYKRSPSNTMCCAGVVAE